MNFAFKVISGIVAVLGIHQLIRFLKRRKTVFILYHNPDPETFKSHLQYLSERYAFISLDDFLGYQNNPSKKLPDYSMVITFDDGHRNNFQLLEVISQFNIRPTIYVCSGVVCTNRKFWFKLKNMNAASLKNLDNQKRIEYLKQVVNFSPEQEFSSDEREALTQEEIRQLNPYIDFQSHTHLHPILTTCDDATAQEEIAQSRSVLSKIVANPVLHFAYPNGDYSLREVEMLKKAGYRSARTTNVGWNDRTTDPFQLKITGVNDRAPIWMLKAELSGIPGYLYNLYKSGISLCSLQGRHVSERNPV